MSHDTLCWESLSVMMANSSSCVQALKSSPYRAAIRTNNGRNQLIGQLKGAFGGLLFCVGSRLQNNVSSDNCFFPFPAVMARCVGHRCVTTARLWSFLLLISEMTRREIDSRFVRFSAAVAFFIGRQSSQCNESLSTTNVL